MQYGPYGLAGHDLGGYALDLSIMLRAHHEQVPVAADNEPTWSEDDRDAFDTYVDFRRASDSVGLDHEMSNNVFYSSDRWKRANELSRSVDLFHVALPFSEGERRWLLDYAMAFGFGRVGDCEAAYREASDTMRRQFNLAFFERLLIDEDYTVRGELAPPFDVILSDELRRRAVAKADETTRQAIKEARQLQAVQVEAENEQRPQAVLVGADSPTTSFEVGGWSQNNMVELVGLEPTASAMPWRRSPS
jgi:hypothetical protein